MFAKRRTELLEPFTSIAIDIIGPFETPEEEFSVYGPKYWFLTIIDCFTRFIEIFLFSSIGSVEVTNTVYINWLSQYPLPTKIHPDRGTQFFSVYFSKMMEKFNIKHCPTLSYNPQGNSIIERSHKEIGVGLRAYLDLKILMKAAKIASGLRSTFHRSIGCSPTSLTFGRNKLNKMNEISIQELMKIAQETSDKSRAENKKNINKKESNKL